MNLVVVAMAGPLVMHAIMQAMIWAMRPKARVMERVGVLAQISWETPCRLVHVYLSDFLDGKGELFTKN